MAEELSFVVSTDLAPVRDMNIVSNSKDVLAAVREIVAPYKNLVVTPETRKAAKDDLARLRRLRTNIDEQRKAVKKICTAAYDRFEKDEIKPILAEIDEAISPVDAQVKAQEAAEVQEKLDGLRAYFNAVNNKEAAGFADFDKIAKRHPDWKNKGCSVERAQSDIQVELAAIEQGIKAIRSPAYGQYVAPMLEKYAEDYRLADAINVYTQIKRREEMERAAAQREAERHLREAEAERQRREIAAQATQALNREFTNAAAETPAEPGNAAQETAPAAPTVKRVEFWVEVTGEQAKALGAFLKANGIKYGAVKR